MNQEQVIEWARGVGAMVFQDVHGDWIIQMGGSRAERFAALVAADAAAKEREACAQACADQAKRWKDNRGLYVAYESVAAIRARGNKEGV